MITLKLISGDYDVDSSGHHVCDGNGFAIRLTEAKTIEITEQADYDRINTIIEAARIQRGLNADV